MKKQFVPYILAFELKALGFNEECMANYTPYKKTNVIFICSKPDDYVLVNYVTNKANHGVLGFNDNLLMNDECLAPLWQQAFDWFREKHNLFSFIDIYITQESWYNIRGENINNLNGEPNNSYMSGWFNSHEEAREGCLIKLIEICKNR